MAGVVAQYLEMHPNASAVDVRRALQRELSSPGTVTGLELTPGVPLLFTNLSSARAPGNGSAQAGAEAEEGGSADSGGSGLSAWLIVVISASGVAGECCKLTPTLKCCGTR